MTREILFRGKRVDTGEWVYGHYTQGSEDFHYITKPNGAVWQVDPSSIGEFTGLLDKDGNKIFEGDVVRCYDHPTDIDSVTGIVEFENGRYWTHDSRLISIDQYGSIWLTLLGNIHDNPELNQ